MVATETSSTTSLFTSELWLPARVPGVPGHNSLGRYLEFHTEMFFYFAKEIYYEYKFNEENYASYMIHNENTVQNGSRKVIQIYQHPNHLHQNVSAVEMICRQQIGLYYSKLLANNQY